MKLIRNNVWGMAPGGASSSQRWSRWNVVVPAVGGKAVFNTWTGAVVLMEQEEYDSAMSEPSKVPPILKTSGIVVDGDVDEAALWAEGYQAGKNDESSLDLTIAVTMQCQFRCVYCFEGNRKAGSLDEAGIEAIKRYVERRRGLLKILRVTWFGGEPLMNMPAIRELSDFFIAFCEENGVKYVADMTTNGYALTQPAVHELVTCCKVMRYIITVDGPEAVHDRRRPLHNGRGTFAVIWKNIHRLVEAGAHVTVRVTIDRQNAAHIRELIDNIAESGLAGKVYLALVKTFDYASTPQEMREDIQTLREFSDLEVELTAYAQSLGVMRFTTPRPCPQGGCLRKGDVVIGTSGHIYKCLDTLGEEEWICGHVDEEDTGEAQWFADWENWNPANNGKCSKCPLLPLCNGGCPHNVLFTTKKHGTEDHCPDWVYTYRPHLRMYVEDKIERKEYEEI